MEDNKAPEVPLPCSAGCGFYGNKIYNNMCSKCFREHSEQNKKEEEARESPAAAAAAAAVAAAAAASNTNTTTNTTTTTTTTTNPSLEKQEQELKTPATSTSSSPPPPPQQQQQQPATTTETKAEASKEKEEEEQPPSKPVQKNTGRCFMCRSKIPLAKQLSNKCRCEYVFCDSHRYPDKHDCDFDHASMDKDILAKKNPKLNERPRGGRSFQRLDSM